MKRLVLFGLIGCLLVSGCRQSLPARPLTFCFSAVLSVADGDTVWQGQLTVTETAYEWVLTDPPKAAGYRLTCDGETATLAAEGAEPLVTALGILPPDGIPAVLWCALFDSDRRPVSWDGKDGLSTGYTPAGVYELRTDAGSGLPLSLRPVGGNWSAVFERSTKIET